ncbi:MAG: glycosyltransferase family 39 protein [Acidobacteriaceae bacterium]
MTHSSRRWVYAVWLVLIAAFAVLHALNLRADFPNHSPWHCDGARYTDEGWYGNAAIRAHLFGRWYLPGDFNPAPAVPLWPFLEWLLFFFTGVTLEAARGLAIAIFFANLLLSYLLLRASGSRWRSLFALTLLATSPFLYCFSRLAILEPLLTALTLAALNVAVRLPRMRRPLLASISIGLLFTLMMLTKPTAIFLLPALGCSMMLALRQSRKPMLRCALAAASAFAFSYGLWMALVAGFGLLPDYKYLFTVNTYSKPPEFYWPLLSFWWSFHGSLWVDRILIPLAVLAALGAVLVPFAAPVSAGRTRWSRSLLLDPVFAASICAVAGYILFMTCQNHPQPRYYAVVAFFSFLALAQGAEALLGESAPAGGNRMSTRPARLLGWGVVALAAVAVVLNGARTLNYALHPEYTFVTAARQLTEFIDEHPNGNRLLVSISGDQITLATHLPTLCDDFSAPSPSFPDLPAKLAFYHPGWYAAWNNLDFNTLEDLHTHFSLEQVASFPAFDDPKRNLLVLFSLHPLPGGQVRDAGDQDLQAPLPGDRIGIPVL